MHEQLGRGSAYAWGCRPERLDALRQYRVEGQRLSGRGGVASVLMEEGGAKGGVELTDRLLSYWQTRARARQATDRPGQGPRRRQASLG